jgi:hypothetical protein
MPTGKFQTIDLTDVCPRHIQWLAVPVATWLLDFFILHINRENIFQCFHKEISEENRIRIAAHKQCSGLQSG